MHRMLKIFAALAIVVIGQVSCGNSEDVPLLAGNAAEMAQRGEIAYQNAKSVDDRGDRKKAAKLYSKMAANYPLAPSAGQALFREAEIHEQAGDVLKAFDAYQLLITRQQGSGLYSEALARQSRMAQAAADGEVKSSFLGLKSKLSLEKVTEMLGKVRDNAPESKTAARAQFTMGELYQSRDKPKEAIDAYQRLVRDQPNSSEAPEALFRVGVVLTEQAQGGNQNTATLDLAREAFQDYLNQYPSHRRNAEAREFLKTLSGQELERSLSIAQFYDRTGQLESAKVYYRDLVKRTKSGSVHDAAQKRLAELGE